MKRGGIGLILFGIVGALFVATFDIITRKPVNDLTGPKSIIGFLISAILIISGIVILLKNPKK